MCPQTIFMEMVFRRIEYWIDGDRGAQIRLSKQPWNAEKIRKRLLKWALFFGISFLIANVFLAYLIGSDQLMQYISEGPAAHLGTLAALLIFTAAFFFVFTWFREQVCIIACPYGRLQGVLLDDKSLVVAYDYKRGESEQGRKKFRKGEDRQSLGYGDCIDCKQCVHVCPTGIDIRNGTQLECVNCTACIDECDTIMEKVGLPRGLIRYASELEISENVPFRFTGRMKGYAAVLTVLTVVLIGMLFLRNDLEATILRLPGQLYERKEDNIIRNFYSYKLINKTTREIPDIRFELISHNGTITFVQGDGFEVPAQHLTEGTLYIDINNAALSGDKDELKIGVFSGEELIETATARFLAPRSYR